MGYNKFQDRDGVVFLDLTEDTVTESDVLEGVTFHKADGEEAIGTLVAGSNPLEATNDSTMEALLVSENVGKVAQFNGTSDTYVDGGYYLIDSVVQVIQFSIAFSLGHDTVTFQAEEGMTWGEWIESAYNNDNTLAFTAYTTYISVSYNNGSASYKITGVGTDDVIIDGNTYTASYAAGGAT